MTPDEISLDPSSRLPVIFLLDLSSNMSKAAINELNRGIRQFLQETKEDATASRSVDLEIITFSDVATVEIPFQKLSSIDENTLPTFTADGKCAMDAALSLAEKELQERQKYYMEIGFSTYKPWIIMLSNGKPTGAWKSSAKKLKDMCFSHGYTYLGIGVGDDVDWDTLRQIVPDSPGPLKLKGIDFKEFFMWITDSLKMTTQSAVELPDTGNGLSIAEWKDLV